MKRILLLTLFVFVVTILNAQKDSLAVNSLNTQKNSSAVAADINISIYPVPVRNNLLNIKCDQPISFVKITNIIGQDLFRTQYNNPQTIIKIPLDNPKRGMYLVTIIFSDGVRIVKKIMIEQSE
jgi:hypothetical protein